MLANKHINSKVDNQVGFGWRGGGRGPASGVKRAVQREQSWPVQSLSRVVGEGAHSGVEALPKVWNFNHWPAAEITF